jgi:catechol 2,3-dioxygenase-like lactoylglutathione lyase family enzyme
MAANATSARGIATIALVVRDYDEAKAFYTEKLGFTLLEDTHLAGTGVSSKRWVRVQPPDTHGACLLLARAVGSEQEACVGKQGGGRVMFFLETADFAGTYERMKEAGVVFCEGAPREEKYATVIVFQDLYGNKWDLLQPKN